MERVWDDPRPPAMRRCAITSLSTRRVDAAWLDDERIQPQEGDFYGGWITSDLIGPFTGPAGTLAW